MSGRRMPLGWVLAVLGAAMLWVASLLYSDVMGLTDYVLMEDGRLAFRLPFGSGEALPTPISSADMRSLIARVGAALVVVMASILIVVGAPRRASWVRRLATWPRGVQGLVAAALVLASATALLPLGEGAGLAFYFVLAIGGATLLLRGMGTPSPRVAAALRSTLSWLSSRGGWTVAGVAALALLCLASAISVFAFDRTPHVVDAISHLFQTRIFARGRLFLPSHPLPEFFDVDTIVNNGRWFSQYTPGHTILLFIGASIGASWLVNPVLGALSVLALYALGRELFDDATARLSAVLLVVSPFVVLMSTEYYSHASALLFVILTLLHYARFVRRGEKREAVLAGAFLGFCVLSRPLSALACSLPLVVDALTRLGHLRRERQLAGALMGVVTVVTFCALLLLYNRGTTGQWLAFGYAQAEGPGFPFAALNPLPLMLERLRLLNDALFALPFPSLVLAACAFLGGKPSRWDFVLIGIPVALLLAHAPVDYGGMEFGPRYLYEATGALVLLSARGVLRAREVLQRFAAPTSATRDVLVSTSWVLFLLFAAAAALQWQPRIAYYASPRWRWAVHDDAARAARTAGLTNAIVFVSRPDVPGGDRWWESVFLENTIPPDAGSVIFARDLGALNESLIELYPSRQAYLAKGDTIVPLR